jgi:uncharacterized protein YbcI
LQEGGEKKAPLSSIEHAPKGSVAAAISSAVVKLMHEYTGRGPTKARTYINDDLITVVLQDTLTMGERSLVRDGKGDLVLVTRRAFQQTMSTQMIAAVERHSGRMVHAFLSDNHVDPDTAVESFVLEPLHARSSVVGAAEEEPQEGGHDSS